MPDRRLYALGAPHRGALTAFDVTDDPRRLADVPSLRGWCAVDSRRDSTAVVVRLLTRRQLEAGNYRLGERDGQLVRLSHQVRAAGAPADGQLLLEAPGGRRSLRLVVDDDRGRVEADDEGAPYVQERTAMQAQLLTTVRRHRLGVAFTGYFGAPTTRLVASGMATFVLRRVLGVPEVARVLGIERLDARRATVAADVTREELSWDAVYMAPGGKPTTQWTAVPQDGAVPESLVRLATVAEARGGVLVAITTDPEEAAALTAAGLGAIPTSRLLHLARRLEDLVSQRAVPGATGSIPAQLRRLDTGAQVNLRLDVEGDRLQLTAVDESSDFFVQRGAAPCTVRVAVRGERPLVVDCTVQPGPDGTVHSAERVAALVLRQALTLPEVGTTLPAAVVVVPPPGERQFLHGQVVSLDDARTRVLDEVERLLAPYGDVARSTTELREMLDRPPRVAGRLASELPAVAVTSESLLATADGVRLASLLVLEHLADRAVASPPPAPGAAPDAQLFASAVRTYLVACATQHPSGSWYAHRRLLQLLREWLTLEHARPTLPTADLLAPVRDQSFRSRLQRVAVHAPEVLFLVRRGAHLPWVEVTLLELVHVLAVARPRLGFRRSSDWVSPRWSPVEAETVLTRLRVPDEVAPLVTEVPGLVDELAEMVQELFVRPETVLRRAQLLGGRPAIQAAVEEAAMTRSAERAGSVEDVLVVHDVTPAGTDLLLVNLDPDRRVEVQVDEHDVLLRECAADERGASAFAWVLRRLPRGPVVLRSGAAARQVDGQERPRFARRGNTLGVDIDDAFRGRESELSTLSLGIWRGLTERSPSVVYGTRRAGKSTLAVQSLRRAAAAGELDAYALVDIADKPNSTEEEGYEARLAHLLRSTAADRLGIPLQDGSDDPVAVLTELDNAAGAVGRSVGLVLDEFDTLLIRDPGTPLRRLASRLGALTWRNLSLVLTVQRFSATAAEFKSCRMVACPPSLDWRSGLTYFCAPLASADGPRTAGAATPVLSPDVFAREVVPRLGLRPYFWGRLYSGLENELLTDPEAPRLVTAELVHELVDQMLIDDTHLALPLMPTAGWSSEECRRKDLFSEGERRILAQFATSSRQSLPHKAVHDIGGPEAITELLDREYLRVVGKELTFAVGIFGEYLRRNQNAFLAYADDSAPVAAR